MDHIHEMDHLHEMIDIHHENIGFLIVNLGLFQSIVTHAKGTEAAAW